MNLGFMGNNHLESGMYDTSRVSNRPFTAGGGQIYQGNVGTGHHYMSDSTSVSGGKVDQGFHLDADLGLKLAPPALQNLFGIPQMQ